MGVEKLPQIADAAVAAEAATGCPAELMAAQCILESGWLSFAPQNNCFGIKTYSGEFGRQLLRTTEWFNASELAAFLSRGDSRTATRMPAAPVNGRSKYSVQDWFATFATLAGCFEKRGALFTVGPYAPFAAAYKANRDITVLVDGIGPIYATDPSYAKSVLTIINQSNVQQALATARNAPLT